MSLFRNEDNFITIDQEWINKLKKAAFESPKHMSRLLVHHSTDDFVQEMIMAFTQNCQIYPNHLEGKSESLVVYEGEIELVNFDEMGNVKEKIQMGAYGSGLPFAYRFNATPWHLMIIKTDVAVVHEYLQGPFEKSEKSNPTWIPTNAEELNSLLGQL
jgi:cupin fold WbuC family metalloprotein